MHPPTLTGAGEAFLPHARAVIAEWSAAVTAVTSRSGRISGTVSVGSVPSVSSQLITPVIARMSKEHPGVTFDLHEGPNTWLDDALAHRTVELCIRPIVGDRHAGVIRRPVLTDPFVIIVRKDHPLAALDVAPLAHLAGVAIVTTGEAGLDARVGSEFRRVLDPVPIDVERSMAVTQPTTVFALVKAGVGVGLIGLLAADMLTDDELVVRPLAAPGARRLIGAYWAGTRQLSTVAKCFLDEVDEFVREGVQSGRFLPPGEAR